MQIDLLAALALYAFVTSATPGPNNLMLMASGANFGIRRTRAHLFGVTIGFVAMIVVLGAGAAPLFARAPALHTALKVASVAYMGWLAWRIAHAAPPQGGDAAGKPLSFLQAAAFQWVNPKAWAMALTAVSVYTPPDLPGAVLLVAAVFGAVNLPSCAAWVVLGQQVRRVLRAPRALRWFNRGMAALLLAALWPIVTG